MAAASSADVAVTALLDQLAILADALAAGDLATIEASEAVVARLGRTLADTAAMPSTVAPSGELVGDALWQLQRCRRLGATWLALGPVMPGDRVAGTYLPTGAPATPLTATPSLEVTA